MAVLRGLILAVRAPNGRKPVNHRLVLGGIFWIARTGSQWRDLPAEFGKWSSVYRQFRRWTLAGLNVQPSIRRGVNPQVPSFDGLAQHVLTGAHRYAAPAPLNL